MIRIIAIILLFFTCSVQANEEVLRKFILAYNQGNASEIPTKSADIIDEYAEFFSRIKDRKIKLVNVRWSDTRITADYYAVVDGKDAQGNLTIFVKDGLITRMEDDDNIYKESDTNLADSGQVADKGTTVAGLATNTVIETNPILASVGGAGIAAAGVGLIALRNTSIKDQSLTECIEASKSLGGLGWGAAGNNILAMLGAGPIALLFGLGSGTVVYNQEYKGSCVEGPIRFASME